MVIGLIIIAAITIGVETKIDTSLIESSGLTKASLIGWQLIYILPVAILTNDFFLVRSQFRESRVAPTLLNIEPGQLTLPVLDSRTSGFGHSPRRRIRTSGWASRAPLLAFSSS